VLCGFRHVSTCGACYCSCHGVTLWCWQPAQWMLDHGWPVSRLSQCHGLTQKLNSLGAGILDLCFFMLLLVSRCHAVVLAASPWLLDLGWPVSRLSRCHGLTQKVQLSGSRPSIWTCVFSCCCPYMSRCHAVAGAASAGLLRACWPVSRLSQCHGLPRKAQLSRGGHSDLCHACQSVACGWAIM
jgi:hypothetical protein